MKFHLTPRKIVWIIFLLGFFLRVPVVFQPIQEGYRAAQTAALTEGMLENGKLRFDSIAPWRGDLDARLLQELPIYNLTVLSLRMLVPVISLDAAGRVVSLLFWAASFWLLQLLWRRLLRPQAWFWANFLFVISPMNWYLATAFMPETLVQMLSIAFILLVLSYAEDRKLQTFAGLIIVAALGLLLKLPAFAHLGLFAAFVCFDRMRYRVFFRPEIWIGIVIIAVLVGLWGNYTDSINQTYFPYWTSRENLQAFIGPLSARLNPAYYMSLAGYNLAFIMPIICAPFVVVGLWSNIRQFRMQYSARVWTSLLISLFVYVMLWHKAAPLQNYYNLPNLVLFCGLFAEGIQRTAQWLSLRENLKKFVIPAAVALIFSMALLGFAGMAYLSRPDKVTLRVAEWVNAQANSQDIILFQPRHLPAVIDYEHQPLLSYLTKRRTWLWTRLVPEWEKKRALDTAAFLVVTDPSKSTSKLESLRQKFKGKRQIPPSIGELFPDQLTVVAQGDGFTVFRMSSRMPDGHH